MQSRFPMTAPDARHEHHDPPWSRPEWAEGRIRAAEARGADFVLEMEPVPAPPGGALEGAVVMSTALPAESRLKVTLACWMRAFDSDDFDVVLWETEEVIEIVSAGAGDETRVPIRIEIPATCSASHPARALGGPYWELRVEGSSESAARGLRASFEVPVFVTEETIAALQAGRPIVERRPLASTIVVDHPAPGVTRFRFHQGPVAVFFMLVLPGVSPLALLAPISSLTAIAASGLLIAFSLLLQFMDPMGFEVSPRALTLRRGFRGWFGRRRIPLADVKGILIDDCVNGLKQVNVRTRDLDEPWVSRIVGVMEARWLAAELRAALTAAGARLDA